MKSPQESQLTEKFQSVGIDNNPKAVAMSSLESLPLELMFNVFEYVPEAVCELRLTSKALKALVDQCVLRRPTITIVHKIDINDHYYRYDAEQQTLKENDPGTMRIWLLVPARTAPLFELRVMWCGLNRMDIMGRHENEDHGRLGFMNLYFFNCDIPVANDANKSEWTRMAECIGSKIDQVDVYIRAKTQLAPMCSLLDQFRIGKLEVGIERLSEIETGVLLKTVQHLKLDCLELRMDTTTTPTFAEFLLELSSHLRTLHIHGDFAVSSVQRVPLIIEMLSRKLDTFHMKHWRGEILSRADADRLIMHLPFIGKKMWFKVGFARNTVGRSNKLNGHIIHETSPIPRPNKPTIDRALTIIHKSRLNEVSPRCCLYFET